MHYFCTDRFLRAFLGTILHPDTKGSHDRVLSHLRGNMGWKGHLLPTNRAIYHTMCEQLMKHPVITDILACTRKQADKRVVGIDGQYSVLMSVLYQTQLGTEPDKTVAQPTEQLHVVLSVQCQDTILLVKPAPWETYPYLVDALVKVSEALRGAERF